MRAGPVGTASCFDARPDVTEEWGHDCSRTEFREHRMRRRALRWGRSVPADRTVPDAMGRRGCPASLTGGRSGCGAGADRAEAGEPTRQSGAGRFSGRALLIWVLSPRRWRGAGPSSLDDRRTGFAPEGDGRKGAAGKGRRAGSGRKGTCFSGEGEAAGRGGKAIPSSDVPTLRAVMAGGRSGERMRVPCSDRPRLGRRVRPSFGKRGSTISHRYIDR